MNTNGKKKEIYEEKKSSKPKNLSAEVDISNIIENEKRSRMKTKNLYEIDEEIRKESLKDVDLQKYFETEKKDLEMFCKEDDSEDEDYDPDETEKYESDYEYSEE